MKRLFLIGLIGLVTAAPVAAEHAKRWPPGTRITVRDYTISRYEGKVEASVAAWNEALVPFDIVMTVVDEEPVSCQDLGSFKEWPVAENEIWVCNTGPFNGNKTGGATFSGYPLDIDGGYAWLERKARRKQALVSHELGHTLGLARHTKGKTVMNPNLPVKFPKERDVANLAALYE